MKSTELAKILAPFGLLANKHAMSLVYKTLEITADTIRGCAPWGILEVSAEIGIKDTVYIDATQFVNMVKTLPVAEITFEQTATTLSWECRSETASAEGKFALLGKVDIPTHDWEATATEKANTAAEFIEALQLGALCARRDISMASSGVNGVSLTWEEADDKTHEGLVYITSSDNITMSVATTVIDGAAHWPSNIVINTDAATMLGTILSIPAKQEGSKDDAKPTTGAFLDIQEKCIIAYTGDLNFRLMVRATQPFQHDILALTKEFPREEITTKMPTDTVKRFIARATGAAEAKAHTQVGIMASSKGLRLSFSEGTVASAEDYKLTDLTLPDDFPVIRLDALKLARALGHADMLALDAFDRGVLSLFTSKGRAPEFAYLINGAKEKGA